MSEYLYGKLSIGMILFRAPSLVGGIQVVELRISDTSNRTDHNEVFQFELTRKF